MTEKEKAAEGELYDANGDRELIEERDRAKRLLYKYNHLSPELRPEREAVLAELFGALPEGCLIEAPFHCDYGYNITLGRNFYANVNCVLLDGARITIGDNVFLAPNVGIYTAGHPLDAGQRRAGLEYAYPVTIGSDVWIGAGSSILPGVSIGDRTVIGAGSVVTKDIPSDALAVGNPCRVIRKL